MRQAAVLPWRRAMAVGAGTALLCALAWAGNPETPTSDPGAERAVWTEKQAHFVYQGFTTHYSCEGLKHKVRKALLQLGARKDLEVREGACTNPSGGPEPFPSVDVKMNVLELARASDADRTDEAVAAHWQRIELQLDRDPLSEAGDCELMEQFKHTLLPLFTARNVDYQSACIAHQLTPAGTWLKADLLLADPKSSSTPR